MSNLYHYVGCVHIHCPPRRSQILDSLCRDAANAGVNFLLLTPHSPERWQPARYFSQEGYHGTTLVLTGEEVDAWTEKNHLLVYGAGRWLGKQAIEAVVPEIGRKEGLSFIAHPFGRHNIFGRRAEHRWTKHHLNDRVTGIEIWSLLFDLAKYTNPINLPFRYRSYPDNLKGPDYLALRLWDAMLAERCVPAICGLDIHPLAFFLRPLDVKKTISFEFSFRILRNHVLTRSPLTGRHQTDRRIIVDALRTGRLYCANDYLHDSKGFFFGSEDGTRTMGDGFARGEKAVVRIPSAASIRMIRNGRLWKKSETSEMSVEFDEPGFYRAEVYLKGKPWIFTNPIYVA